MTVKSEKKKQIGLLTLPEWSILRGFYVYFAEFTNMHLLGVGFFKFRLFVHSVLLATLCEWEVKVLLESDAKWHRDLVRGALWKTEGISW